MKKILAIAAVLLLVAPLSAMAGMTAFLDMDELSDAELAATKGQTGITINQTVQITGGYIAWGDDDGCATGGTQGWLMLDNITAGPIVQDGVDIDVCTEGNTTTWLVVDVPALTITAGVSRIRLGSTLLSGNSLGELVIHSLQISASVLEITSH